ncbi:MAG TPA: hypothetical protein VKV25_08595 [Acidimicrobiales bacterium]|nr:hypothetical protein [Acidimicrobiales bacterium]
MKRTGRVRTVTVGAALAGALTLATAACGSSGRPAATHTRIGGPNAVSIAYTASLHAKTARFDMVASLRMGSGQGNGQDVTFGGSGGVDFATHDYEMAMRVPAVGTMRLIQTGGMIYLRMPASARGQLPAGKSWISVDLEKVSEARFGRSLGQLGAFSNDDPTQVLSQLSGVSSRISRVGSGTVGGVRVTEYRADVDLAKVVARVRARAGARAAQAVQAEEHSLHARTLPVTVWIDSQHLVRRMDFSVPMTVASVGQTYQLSLRMDFSRYGAPLHITAPPAASVQDMTPELLHPSSTLPTASGSAPA